MKKIKVVLPDGYDDAVSITAVGSETKSETCHITNIMTKIADITEHDGDVLVLVEKGDVEWRKPETGWIPVSERLPEKDGLYLCVVDDAVTQIYFNADFEEFGFWDAKYDSGTLGAIDTEWNKIESVTHWMPLPEPPEGC